MTRFGDYVERATERLRSDPFVRRDVRRELEAHLEDAAEEARAGGAAEDDAQEHALRAFGDADALAEQLYEANRTRMRLRWWGKWATRLVLVPATLALAVVVGAYGLGVARRAIDVARYGGDVFSAFADTTKPRPRPRLTEEQKWLFREATADRREPGPARAIMERFPHDPAAYAYYIRRNFESSMAEPDKAQPDWTTALEGGRRVDPDNALYDYLLAYTLLAQSTRVMDQKGITFEYRQSGWRANLEPSKVELPTLQVTDENVFRQAMAAAEAGFRKPTCTGRVAEWEDRMQDLWTEPGTYEELLTQWTHHAAALMPHLHPLRLFTNRLPAASMLLGERDSHDEAVLVAQQMDRPGVQLGADAHILISILVAQNIYTKMAGAAPVVLERMGDAQAARSAEGTFQDVLGAYAMAVPARANDEELEKAVLTRGGMVAQEVRAGSARLQGAAASRRHAPGRARAGRAHRPGGAAGRRLDRPAPVGGVLRLVCLAPSGGGRTPIDALRRVAADGLRCTRRGRLAACAVRAGDACSSLAQPPAQHRPRARAARG